MIQPAVVYQRSGAGDLSADEVGKLAQLRDVLFLLYAAAAGNQHLSLMNSDSGLHLLLYAQDLVITVGIDLHILYDHISLSRAVRRERIEYVCSDRDHLWAQLRDGNVGQQASSKRRRCLHGHAFVVKTEIHGVGGKAGTESTHYTGRKVSALCGGRKNEY